MLPTCAVFIAALLPLQAAPPADSPPPVAAVVLAVAGQATIETPSNQPRPARVLAPVFEGDAVATAAGGQVTLGLLEAGQWVLLPEGKSVVVSADGCRPAGNISVQSPPDGLSPQRWASLAAARLAPPDTRSAFRETDEDLLPPAVLPIHRSRISSLRPAFRWPAVEKAPKYRFELVSSFGYPLLMTDAPSNELAYPSQQPDLKPGRTYRWRATVVLEGDRPGPSIQATFYTGSKYDEQDLAAVRPWFSSRDPARLLLAAMECEALHYYAEALDIYGTLCQRCPGEPHLQAAEARLWRYAGRAGAATAPAQQKQDSPSPLP
jgi:hypothetical protein